MGDQQNFLRQSFYPGKLALLMHFQNCQHIFLYNLFVPVQYFLALDKHKKIVS